MKEDGCRVIAPFSKSQIHLRIVFKSFAHPPAYHPQPSSSRFGFVVGLRTRLLLLLLPQSRETDTGDLDNLETHTGNITLGLALTTETGEEDFVVLVDEVEAAVILKR